MTMHLGQVLNFEEWTEHRVPAVIGTNTGSKPLAFQNWRKFKEAFVPELIQRAVRETSDASGRPVKRCIDPFAGSGTTPLACQFLGVHPVAIEVNPYLADLVEAKLTPVDTALVARSCAEIIATAGAKDPLEFYAEAPRTFVEPGTSGRYLFSLEVAGRMAGLVAAIEQVEPVEIQRLLRVLLGSAVMDVCHASVSGKGRRYRKNWENLQFQASDLDASFITAVEQAVYDIERFSERPTLTFDLFRGDSRSMLQSAPNFDLAVFSPPYPNSFDYTDVYNVELWALRYLQTSNDNKKLRGSTLRSHVQIARDFGFENLSPSAADAVAKLRDVETLWNPHIPEMVGAYFSDLESILIALKAKLEPKGRVYSVVGDSRYAGIDVPVAQALSECASRLGFNVVSSEPFRSMRASPQQGGKPELPETLLTFEID
jgi:hypothetical protein